MLTQRLKSSLLIAAVIGFLPIALMTLASATENLSENSFLGFFFGIILLASSLFYSPVQLSLGLPREAPSDFLLAAILYFAIVFGICYWLRRPRT